jgi:hypothetical protein
MAKAFTLDRATAQPSTTDTVKIALDPLGTTIPGMQTTSLFPARCVNLFTVFSGDPYMLSLSAVGDIEVYSYLAGTWTLVGGPFTPALGHLLTPLCLHVVNDQLVAIWSDQDGGNVQFSAATSFDGTTWTAPDTTAALAGVSTGGHSIVYRGAVWFATSIGLWAYAPLNRFLTLAGIAGTFAPGDAVTGSISLTTAVVTSFNSPLLRVDNVSGAGFGLTDVITGPSGSGNVSSISRFVNASPDIGNDTFLGAAGPGDGNQVGCFASWDGRLYFVQPKTASNPIRLYQLAAGWDSGENVAVPQWTSITFSGIGDAGFVSVGADSGMWALFVNKNDELCLAYSGSGSTKLAKTTSKTLPLMFTDLSVSLLPTDVSSKTNAGITLYSDDRRRANILQWLLIRDITTSTLIVTSWDGGSSVVVEGSIVGSNHMLPASYSGEQSTFTNLQPTAKITGDSQPFPGRVRIDYVLRSSPSRTLSVLGEYSLDGDEYFPMTQGDADSGTDDLPATFAGIPYFFNWDAFADLDGDLDNVKLRIVARISGV